MKTFIVDGRQAFTLTELMAAIAIFTILVTLVFSIVNNAAGLITITSQNLDAYRVARECLDLIGNDLSVTASSYDNRLSYTANRSYNSTKQSLQLEVNPTGIDSKYCLPHTMFWQAPSSRANSSGNLAIIGYYLLRDLEPNQANQRLQLRRLYVEPEAPASPPPTSAKYLIYSAPSAWHPDSLLATFAPDTTSVDNSNGEEGWAADGVLAMWIRCLDPNGNPILKKADGTAPANAYTFNSRDSYQYTDSSNVVHYPATSSASLPAYIEVGLVCTSSTGARHIKALPTPAAVDPSKFYQEIDSFTQAARGLNPQDKSIGSFSRKFRLYATPSP